MLLCLDVGNSHIFGGVFQDDKIVLRFRHATYNNLTSDQLGVFLKDVLKLNGLEVGKINQIAICSVVPSLDYSLRSACKKYFQVESFVLNSSCFQKSGIKILTDNPEENGSDILAGVVAALDLYQDKDMLVVDLGTVTTIAAVTKERHYLGVSFIPGLYTTMKALGSNAAKLFPVEIISPQRALGKSTIESMQSGIFWGHLGAIKEIVSRITAEVFSGAKPTLIATGGFSRLFERENYFDHTEQDLVLLGIKIISDREIDENE